MEQIRIQKGGQSNEPEMANRELEEVDYLNLDGKKVTLQMILGPKVMESILKEKKHLRAEKEKAALLKMTHLHLENKSINIIDNLDLVPNLMNVYLQENKIYSLMNNPFKGLSKVV